MLQPASFPLKLSKETILGRNVCFCFGPLQSLFSELTPPTAHFAHSPIASELTSPTAHFDLATLMSFESGEEGDNSLQYCEFRYQYLF